MAIKKRSKKSKKSKKAATKKRATKKAATKKRATKKEGFPTLKQMRKARDTFAEEVGPKILTMSNAKALPKAMGLRASSDFTEALARKIYLDVFKAAKRCVANDRKTIRPDDL